jgi:hypothetical protein
MAWCSVKAQGQLYPGCCCCTKFVTTVAKKEEERWELVTRKAHRGRGTKGDVETTSELLVGEEQKRI